MWSNGFVATGRCNPRGPFDHFLFDHFPFGHFPFDHFDHVPLDPSARISRQAPSGTGRRGSLRGRDRVARAEVDARADAAGRILAK